MAQGGDSITWLHTGFTLQKAGERLDTLVHLRVGERPAGMQVLLSETVRRVGRVVFDPVEMRDGH
jgi:hypothetical protein